MKDNQPLKPICGLQLLRQSEWRFLEATIDVFRSMKTNGVKFSSKTTIRVTEIITKANLSKNTAHDVFRNLCNLGIIWDAGSVGALKYSRFNVKISRLNDLTKSHKDLGWLTHPSCIPILVFGYFTGTSSLEKFKEEVYNHTSVTNKASGWDGTLATVTRTPTQVTVKLTDKGNKLIRSLHAFTDLLRVWQEEPCILPENTDATPPTYDPQQEEFLGITYNTNPFMDANSMSARAVVLYANRELKHYYLAVKSRTFAHDKLRVAGLRHTPSAFVNVDPDNIFSGWISLSSKSDIQEIETVKDKIVKTLKGKDYTEISKRTWCYDVSAVLIKSLGYWVIVHTKPSTGVTLKSIIPILELKLCRRYTEPTNAHVNLLSRKWEFNIDDLELITTMDASTYRLDYFGQMSALCEKYGIDNLLGCQSSVQKYKRIAKSKLSDEPIDDEDEEID